LEQIVRISKRRFDDPARFMIKSGKIEASRVERSMSVQWGSSEQQAALELLRLAWAEDLGLTGDVTSQAIIPANHAGKGAVIAKQSGIVAGLPILQCVFFSTLARAAVELLSEDGMPVTPGIKLAMIHGPMRAILAGERVALNFLQRLSGIATSTKKYVDQLAGTTCQLLDTRKTTPGWRVLEKYAVRCGGGHNHRMGLFDAVLIKNNHLAVMRSQGSSPADTVKKVRGEVNKPTMVEVEVETLEQLREVLHLSPDRVLLDNMTIDQLCEAVDLRNQIAPKVKLEASGGVTLANIRDIALTGVDFVSVGALTHSAPALDICLHYVE
jgi:nicotinate-nucleotide pyrophosphorylase (carboxylating)